MKKAIEAHFAGHWQDFYGKYLPSLKPLKGDEYQAACPFHSDENPSFSLNTQTGKYFCHACAKGSNPFHFYAKISGLDVGKDFPKVLSGIAADFNISSNGAKVKPKISETYDYLSETGELLFQVCRMEPKSFRQRRPDGTGGWIWNLGDIQRVLYRLPTLREKNHICVLEGEKDVHAVERVGLVGTCNPGGAGKWLPAYTESLRGKHVACFPDNDRPGEAHMENVARALHGVAASVKIVLLPDLPEKGDISDYIARFDSKETAWASTCELIEKTPVYIPKQSGSSQPIKKAEARKPRSLKLEELEKMFGAKTEFLWRRHLPKGLPSVIGGREGAGKTTIAVRIAKEILEANETGLVFWLASEGAVQDTVIKMKEIGVSDRFRVQQRADGDFRWDFMQRQALREFEGLLREEKEPILAIFIDSIRGITGLSDNDSLLKNTLIALNAIVCDRMGVSLVYLHHFKKGKTENLLDSFVGTTAVTSCVRVALGVVPVSAYRRAIRIAKCNVSGIGDDLESLKMGSKVEFREPTVRTEETCKVKAEEFLLGMFAERTEISAREIYTTGEEMGISSAVIKKTKAALGIQSYKSGGDGPWYWKFSMKMK